MAGLPKVYSVTGNSNPLQVTLAYDPRKISKIVLNRFEWYPPTSYSSIIPSITIQSDQIFGKIDNNGLTNGYITTVMRNNENCYVKIKTYDDPADIGDYLTNINFSFLDANANPLDLGQNDANAIGFPYLLEFMIFYEY